MSALDLVDPGDYRIFLAIQYAARAPIERWASIHCDRELAPPSQLAVIAADLEALCTALPTPDARAFEADPAGAIGVAWALAGSSLGNRAMLAALGKRGTLLPTAFLGDPAMPIFFAKLRPILERTSAHAPVAEPAIAAAREVFATFARAAAPALSMKAA